MPAFSTWPRAAGPCGAPPATSSCSSSTGTRPGTFNRLFEPEDVWDYVRAHQPLLEIEQAPIGRSLPSRTDLHNLPLTEVVYHLTGKTREDLLAELDQTPTTLATFDSNDLHVLAAAVGAEADAICSSDSIFQRVEWIDVYRPGELAAEFSL